MIFKFTEPGIIESPVYDPHKRAKNWCAILNGENSVKCIRIFVKMRGSKIDCSLFKEGMAIEIGGDYISGGGVRHPDRRFYTVKSISGESIETEQHNTLAAAMKARRLGNE